VRFCYRHLKATRYAIWIDVHGEGLPAESSIKPDRIIRSLSELLPVEHR
jgi:putative hydrolase of the HAD superfamily